MDEDGRIVARELCLEDVCIDKIKLQKLLGLIEEIEEGVESSQDPPTDVVSPELTEINGTSSTSTATASSTDLAPDTATSTATSTEL